MNITNKQLSVVVVGAGVTGATCAALLCEAGLEVTLLDKGRGLGGRLATRRNALASFNHGCTSFEYPTAQSIAGFEQWVEGLVAQGSALSSGSTHDQKIIGVPSMSRLLHKQLAGIQVRRSVRLKDIGEAPDGELQLQLVKGDGAQELLVCDYLVLAIPAEQARQLLQISHGALAASLAGVSSYPQFSLMLAFADDELDDQQRREIAGLKDAHLSNLSWQEKTGNYHALVVHASRAWSEAECHSNKDYMAQLMLRRLRSQLRFDLPDPSFMQAHRWLYSRTAQPLGSPFLTTELGLASIYVGGDWCLGDQVQHAWSSGHAIAQALLQSLAEVEAKT